MGGWLPSHDAVGETGPGATKTCAISLNIQKIGYYAPLQVGEVELYDAAGTLIPRSSLTVGITPALIEGSNGPADKCIDGETSPACSRLTRASILLVVLAAWQQSSPLRQCCSWLCQLVAQTSRLLRCPLAHAGDPSTYCKSGEPEMLPQLYVDYPCATGSTAGALSKVWHLRRSRIVPALPRSQRPCDQVRWSWHRW
jgi:hypothetical protein